MPSTALQDPTVPVAVVPLTRPAKHDLRDFRPELRSAAEWLCAAGYFGEAHALISTLEGAYETAGEMVGEIGHTILRIQRTIGPALPRRVDLAFQHALLEIRKVYPSLGARS